MKNTKKVYQIFTVKTKAIIKLQLTEIYLI